MKSVIKIFVGVLALVALVVFLSTMGTTPATATEDYMKTGSVSATGAAINVSVGWSPRYVVVSNPATTNITKVEWNSSMASASCLKSKLTTTYNVYSKPSVSCISSYTGSLSAARGFTIGADTDLNISGDTLYYEAFR